MKVRSAVTEIDEGGCHLAAGEVDSPRRVDDMDNGAHFYRCDLQVHSPRDPNWQGERPSSNSERTEFAERLISACRARGLDAIAITDHHDMAYVPVVQAAARSERDDQDESLSPKKQIVVFPGIELTLAVPCQALLLLDPTFLPERFNAVLEALGIDVVDAAEPLLPPVTRLDRINSLRELHERLDEKTWLRGAYIVLPNVTDSGHSTLMRAGMQAKYKNVPCLGGYIDGSVDTKVGTGNQTIFDGRDSAWGNKRIPGAQIVRAARPASGRCPSVAAQRCSHADTP